MHIQIRQARGRAKDTGEDPAQKFRERPAQMRRNSGSANQYQERPEAYRGCRVLNALACTEVEGHRANRKYRGEHGFHYAEAPWLDFLGSGHGRHRWNLSAAVGGDPGSQHLHHGADHERGKNGLHGRRGYAAAQIHPACRNGLGDGKRQAGSEHNAQHRSGNAGGRGFAQHGAFNLAPGCANRAVKREFAALLGHQNRESIGDEEDRDDEGNRGENPQEGGDEGKPGIQVGRVEIGHRLRGIGIEPLR